MLYDENTAIDRITVLGCQLAAFPQELKFGKCLVTPYTSVYFVPNQTLTIPEKHFVRFGDILSTCYQRFITHFKDRHDKTSDQDQETEEETLSWTIGNGKIELNIRNNMIRFLIECELSVNLFHNELLFRQLVVAFTTLVVKCYCYSPLINKNILLFVKNVEKHELEKVTETDSESCESLIHKSIPQASIDYLVLTEIILRHKKLLILINELNSFVPKYD